MKGGSYINWISDEYRKIVLYFIDSTIDEETSAKFKLYCEAFFSTCEIEVVHPGG